MGVETGFVLCRGESQSMDQPMQEQTEEWDLIIIL